MVIPKGGIDFSNCEEDEETGLCCVIKGHQQFFIYIVPGHDIFIVRNLDLKIDQNYQTLEKE